MKKRGFVFIISLVMLFSFLLFPASAAETYISLQNLLDPMRSSDFFNAYVTDDMNRDVFLSYSWYTENILHFDQPAQQGDYKALRLVSSQPSTDPYLITAGDILYMNSGYWLLFDVDSVSTTLDCKYDLIVNYVDRSGNPYSQTILSRKNADYVFGDGRVGIYFDFQYAFPSYAYRLSSIVLNFTFPENSNNILQLSSDGKTQFYLGNPENAPVYGTPDQSEVDDLHAKEEEVFNATDLGRQEIDNLFDIANSAVSGASAIRVGALAISSMISKILVQLDLSPILYISLALGMVCFVLGSVQLLTSRANSSVRADKSQIKRGG